VTKLSGAIQKALAIVDQWDGEGFGDEIALVDIADEIGMDRKDFRKQVAKDSRFKDEVYSRGYVEGDISWETPKGVRTAKAIVRHSVFPEDPSSCFQVADLG